MQAFLYKTTSPKNAINKVLSEQRELNIVLKDDIDILEPYFTMHVFSGLFVYNYVFIPAFSRYYFIENITLLTANVAKIDLKVDVLESWKTDILAAICHITKESNADMYGAEIATSEERLQEVIEHDAIFELQDDFILTVSRGEQYTVTTNGGGY